MCRKFRRKTVITQNPVRETRRIWPVMSKTNKGTTKKVVTLQTQSRTTAQNRTPSLTSIPHTCDVKSVDSVHDVHHSLSAEKDRKRSIDESVPLLSKRGIYNFFRTQQDGPRSQGWQMEKQITATEKVLRVINYIYWEPKYSHMYMHEKDGFQNRDKACPYEIETLYTNLQAYEEIEPIIILEDMVEMDDPCSVGVGKSGKSWFTRTLGQRFKKCDNKQRRERCRRERNETKSTGRSEARLM